MGVYVDNTKVKLHASSISGNYTQWDDGSTLSTNIEFLQLAVVKFSLYVDKSSCQYKHYLAALSVTVTLLTLPGPPAFIHTVALASLRPGYQHVFFDAAEYDIVQPPPSLFMHVMVSLGLATPFSLSDPSSIAAAAERRGCDGAKVSLQGDRDSETNPAMCESLC